MMIKDEILTPFISQEEEQTETPETETPAETPIEAPETETPTETPPAETPEA